MMATKFLTLTGSKTSLVLNRFSCRSVSLLPTFTDWSVGDRDVGQNSNSFNGHLTKIVFLIFCIAIHLIGLLMKFIDKLLK